MKSKLNAYFCLAGVALLVGVGCGAEDEDGTQTPSADSADTEFAEQVYDDYIAGDQYLAWDTIIADAVPTVSNSHSGAYVVSYADDAVLAAMADFQGSFPDGGVLVKAQYSDEAGATLSGYTVMVKRSGFDADNNDWFWAAYNADGDVSAAGQVGGCIGCHTGGTDTDYVLTEF